MKMTHSQVKVLLLCHPERFMSLLRARKTSSAPGKHSRLSVWSNVLPVKAAKPYVAHGWTELLLWIRNPPRTFLVCRFSQILSHIRWIRLITDQKVPGVFLW